MEIRQLRHFIAIAKYQSFSRAAEACYISAQGINMSIARMENELGRKVLHRTRKGVALTPEGEFLLPRAKKIIALIDECDKFFAADSGFRQMLTIAASTGTIEEFAGPIITDFRAEHSEISVKIHECVDTACDSLVLNQEVELGITIGEPTDERLEKKPLFASRHAVIVPQNHPLAEKDSVTVEDLRNVPVCLMNKGTRTYATYRAACHAAGFEPEIELFADNILLVFYMAEAQNMVGISTVHLAKRLSRPALKAIPFDSPDMDWRMYLIKLKTARLSPAAEMLERELLRHVERAK